MNLSRAALAALILAAGCSKSGLSVSAGATVSMHYTLTVDGAVVDSSSGKEPLSFKHGAGEIIPGLEKALLGMKAGEKKSVDVAPAEGYGEANPAAIQKLPRAMLGKISDMKTGMTLQGKTPDGKTFQARIVEIGAKEVTVDMNHPLAGKKLHFDVEIVAVSAQKA